VHHLPSDNPELNPDHHLNLALKSMLNHLPAAKGDRCLEKAIHRQPERIHSFVTSRSNMDAA